MEDLLWKVGSMAVVVGIIAFIICLNKTDEKRTINFAKKVAEEEAKKAEEEAAKKAEEEEYYRWHPDNWTSS
jgi:hypothetical protein